MDLKDLTELERKVFIKLLLGWDNEQLTDHLKGKRGNIKQVVNSIFKKFGVHSKPELLARYMHNIVI
jgi:DNA-binding NarL/FixJ family response regulator|tara:strand:- start:217 stop:417 length:201 start_codon:yes stop_codon:yes gene_type:complete